MRHSARLAVVLVAVAGCGGDDRSPQDVAREYVASDDPEKCDDADLAFLERQTRERGDAAREACRRSVERGSPPKGVRVVEAETRGDEAEVRLEAAGQRIRVRLRRDGDRWRVIDLT